MAIDSDLFLADLHVTAGLVAWRTRNGGGIAEMLNMAVSNYVKFEIADKRARGKPARQTTKIR